jgi:hypothetical protein
VHGGVDEDEDAALGGKAAGQPRLLEMQTWKLWSITLLLRANGFFRPHMHIPLLLQWSLFPMKPLLVLLVSSDSTCISLFFSNDASSQWSLSSSSSSLQTAHVYPYLACMAAAGWDGAAAAAASASSPHMYIPTINTIYKYPYFSRHLEA